MSGSVLTIVTSVLVLLAIGTFTWAWIAYQRGRKSLAWPAVSGTVTESGVRESTSQDSDGRSSTTYCPEVSYDYAVDGRTLSSSRIGVGGSITASQFEAARIANQYPAGAKVQVYYDPADPAYAVLARGANTKLVAVIAAAGVVELAGAVIVNVFLRR